jgi:hypothetical protein
MRGELKNLFIGLFTGILFAGGWAIFIDAQINSLDAFNAVHIVPPICATVAAIAINMVAIERVAMGLSIWFLARDYAPPIPPYPGVSILLQCVFTIMAGFLYFAAKGPTADSDPW